MVQALAFRDNWVLSDSESSLRVVSWNVLCQQLAEGFKLDEAHLEWEKRGPLIQKILTLYPMDVVALMEVDKVKEIK